MKSERQVAGLELLHLWRTAAPRTPGNLSHPFNTVGLITHNFHRPFRKNVLVADFKSALENFKCICHFGYSYRRFA